MELKAGISLQTKQVLSQMQVESLNILGNVHDGAERFHAE